MSAATQYYVITILVYICANVIAAWDWTCSSE